METVPATDYSAEQSVRILIVEDNEATSRLIDKTLVRAGFRAVHASTGAQTIEFISHFPDTLVLLDYRLPDMTAKEIICRLGDNQSVAPFIVMTGEGDERIAVEMMKLGARDYLIKDADFLEFLPQVVKRVTKQLGTEAELKQTRARLKDSERALISLLSNLPGMAYRGHMDSRRTMSFVSEGSIDLIGLKPSDLEGDQSLSYLELIHRDDRAHVLEEIRLAVTKKRPYRITYRLHCAGDDEKWVLEKGAGVFSPDGELQSVEGFITDITDRKKAEEEVKQKNEELLATQGELKDVNTHLERKVQERTFEIERLLNEKDRFISQMAHDLRSPLTPLVALVPMLEKDLQDSESRELVDVINRNVQYMKNLVEKTVRLATVNSSAVELNLRKVNVSKLLADVIRRKWHSFLQSKITVENRVQQEISVPADELLLMEVLDNLISNAIKFMPPEGGRLTLDAQLDDTYVTLSVTDTGIGLTENQASRVFDEFYKVDESRHELGSAGLGLAICRRIVKRHGGKIWARSAGLGKGTTFFIRLPVRIQQDAEFIQSLDQILKSEKRNQKSNSKHRGE
ncbi:MAG: ATP-binding protein [Dehalococcoidia bacterium]|nr:ATP-binding protein [Dehalococcoidia bacterium]